jgi:hypothetical protein
MAGRVAQISNGRAPTQQDGDPKFNNQYRKKKKEKIEKVECFKEC